nr:helix-turn-helix domain-containing protein [Hyphomicrobium sp.]
MSSAFMPWQIEYTDEAEFEARMVSGVSEYGAIARVAMSPAVSTRKGAEIAKSAEDCWYADYVITGELRVEQRGRTTIARRGDVVLYDSALPVKLTELSAGLYEDVAICIPKEKLAPVQNQDAVLGNVVISAEQMIAPLSSALSFLAQNISVTSAQELRALQATCAALLPVAALRSHTRREHADEVSEPPNYYMRELARFIEANIGDATLSPRCAAQHLGISVRYVHKQFAAKGTTFGTYVTDKRLELVRQDLICEACRHHPIFAVAYRWGFNDLSTFIRAFKKKFGYSPREYRLTFSSM